MREALGLVVPGVLALAALSLVVLIWQGGAATPYSVVEPDASPRIDDSAPITPIPPAPVLDPLRVELGERLFHDPLLSRDGTVACSSCHDLASGGADRRALSLGTGNAPGRRNSPTVFNVGSHFAYFWDGRATSLEEQIDGPLHHPDEMASNWPALVQKLAAHKDYPGLFRTAYSRDIDPAAVADAIATFERSLVTPDSPFDRYLRGDEHAISNYAKEGYKRFVDFGCASCHQGVNVGGNMYQRFRVLSDYLPDRRENGSTDLGRFELSGREQDREVFKVPSLRNVALTAPYFHDGSVARLDQAVAAMARHQLGRELTEEDVALITSFLRSLTGQYGGEPLR